MKKKLMAIALMAATAAFGEIWTITVPDDYELIPPAGCAVLLDESKTTEFASYHVIKYRFGAGTIAPAPYARRRRKRRE